MNRASKLRLCALILSVVVISVPAFAGAVITNGHGIYLGVADFGNLGYTDGVTTTLNGSGGEVGVAVYANLSAYGRGAGIFDATTPGCVCEGWGAAANGIGGGSDQDVGGVNNLSLVSFASTASTATVVTTLGGTDLQITQAYAPSASNALYQDTVTLTNTGIGTLSDVMYRRVMDWDIPPGEFDELVTIQGWPATALVDTSDDGFQGPDPLSAYAGLGGCPDNANFMNCGPYDHGALFDFGFGSLGPGESKTFNIFYGAAFNKVDAITALSAVSAEVYSFGNWGGNVSHDGTPITYIFGFGGVGGTVVPPSIPEPGTYLLVMTGLGLILYRRRKA